MLKEFCPLVNSWVSENEQLNGLVGGLIIFLILPSQKYEYIESNKIKEQKINR